MAGAVPRLGSERGLLLTHERPPGDVASYTHPWLWGESGLRLQEGQLTSWIQLGLPPKAQHGATPQFPQPSFPCRGHRGMGERETRGWRPGAGWFPAATPPWPADCSRPSCQVSISPSADPASFPASSHPAVLSENSPLAGWGAGGPPTPPDFSGVANPWGPSLALPNIARCGTPPGTCKGWVGKGGLAFSPVSPARGH